MLPFSNAAVRGCLPSLDQSPPPTQGRGATHETLLLTRNSLCPTSQTPGASMHIHSKWTMGGARNWPTITDPELFLQPPKLPVRKDVGPMYSYVALYKFLPQENNDLALQ